MSTRLHPDASAELEAAAVWYESQRAGLGAALLEEVSRAILTIEEAPSAWPTIRKGRAIRRFLLARYPFALLYQRDDVGIVILAVAHTHRRPFYWRARQFP